MGQSYRNNLMAVRLTLGLLPTQLAEFADIDVKTYRKAEQGKRVGPGTYVKIFKAINRQADSPGYTWDKVFLSIPNPMEMVKI